MNNNYKDGNSFATTQPFSNPYAEGGAIQLRLEKTQGQYLASFGWVVAAGGATLTATPITGNLHPDLNYYRVEVSDGKNKRVTKNLDMANRSADFVVDTSSLDPTQPWTMFFHGAVNYTTGYVGAPLDYKKELGIIGTIGGSGNTIPSLDRWENVSFRLMLESTDDANFTLFPVHGIDIQDGGTVNVNDYSTAALLVNAGSYLFKLQMRRLGQSPIATLPTPAANDIWTAFANTVTFPWPIPKEYTEALNALTIKTSVAGPKTGTMTILVPGEGTKPSVTINLLTDVGV